MDEKQAREILEDTAKEDDGLYALGGYIAWDTDDEDIVLDGDFSLNELEAIVWWMKNKRKPCLGST